MKRLEIFRTGHYSEYPQSPHNGLKSSKSTYLLIFRFLEICCPEFPALNSLAIAVRLSKTLLMTIFYYLKALVVNVKVSKSEKYKKYKNLILK